MAEVIDFFKAKDSLKTKAKAKANPESKTNSKPKRKKKSIFDCPEWIAKIIEEQIKDYEEWVNATKQC